MKCKAPSLAWEGETEGTVSGPGGFGKNPLGWTIRDPAAGEVGGHEGLPRGEEETDDPRGPLSGRLIEVVLSVLCLPSVTSHSRPANYPSHT